LSCFHLAIYYEENKILDKTSTYFANVINLKPFLSSDKMRKLYSKIKYLALTDSEAFRTFLKNLNSLMQIYFDRN
jgi:hypothetical protein